MHLLSPYSSTIRVSLSAGDLCASWQEGNWWTPSNVSPNDLEGKVAEIKARQAINEQNGAYKLEKLKAAEKKAAEKKAAATEREAEMKAKQAKFANKR